MIQSSLGSFWSILKEKKYFSFGQRGGITYRSCMQEKGETLLLFFAYVGERLGGAHEEGGRGNGSKNT